ncbi:bifunctional phosphoribosyl-AMP cyclohydrolase/phosphoribosyl-ATP diphosphatase HisIE [Cerasibacillus terrae]|uniref:Histidine biosynthesis bifunctional protein HisIE n=1 Tax=Cerasibacillus terrae TaxID=2498845 RepID=A0A5C8NX05_9BACI|nr:bifunctional phosphoribosyl-AMP cyclohydrolase/phosphoribosyl-ATP diphosphatase HisIE [Cerasibacillus terrae]TXL65826.1 bifunctional phosphoribosyl-AMP cyclohydrolase/phosphoribosyl-ATP diphosphatase HisIE [Cerasibacillus terrae]
MTIDISNIQFGENGLIPAIIQDAQTQEVLMLAYMNKESLRKTMKTKETWFYSRSRQELWNKGATSGNKQIVEQLFYDCDGDTLLIQVKPLGPACHTGSTSCFFNTSMEQRVQPTELLNKLVSTIQERRKQIDSDSYTAYLFREGLDKILKKIGEEASEVIIGAKNRDKQEVIWEISDLTYHTLVLMELLEVDVYDITEELMKRHIEKKVNKNE